MKVLPRNVALAALVLTPLVAFAATTGQTTDTAKTAAPVAVNLGAGGVNQEASATSGDKKAFARANHVHTVTGILPLANGGTGASVLNCATGYVLTANGTAQSCVALPVPGGTGTVGSTAPTTASYQGGVNSSGNVAAVKICDKSAAITASASGSTAVVLGTSGKRVYICGVYAVSSSATNIKFVEGTNSTCSTGTVDVTGAAPIPATGGFAIGLTPFAVPFMSTLGNTLCVNVDSTTQVGGWISYTTAP